MRDCKAHLSRTAVAHEAHRIDAFTGRARRNEDPASYERTARTQQRDDAIDDFERLIHAAGADLTAGLRAFSGTDHADAALLQEHDIGTRRRVSPHDAIHCRRDGNGRLGREAQCGQ
jgi:hypothetical protein